MIPRALFSPEHEDFRASFRKFLEKEVLPASRGLGGARLRRPRGLAEGGRERLPLPEHARAIRRRRCRSPVQHGHDGRDGQGPHLGPGLFAALRDRGALHLQVRQRSAEVELPATHGARRDHRRHRDERARCRQRPAVGEDQRGQGRRPLRRQRRQDLHHQRLECRPGGHGRQDQPRARRQGHQPDPGGARHAGLRARQALEEARAEGAGHLGTLLRQRQGAGDQPARRTKGRASST